MALESPNLSCKRASRLQYMDHQYLPAGWRLPAAELAITRTVRCLPNNGVRPPKGKVNGMAGTVRQLSFLPPSLIRPQHAVGRCAVRRAPLSGTGSNGKPVLAALKTMMPTQGAQIQPASFSLSYAGRSGPSKADGAYVRTRSWGACTGLEQPDCRRKCKANDSQAGC